MRTFPTLGHKKLFDAFLAAQYSGKTTQRDFAKQLGCTQMFVSHLLRGARGLQDKEIKRQASKRFGIPVASWNERL